MPSRNIAVSRTDLQRLQSLLESHFVEVIGTGRAHLKELKRKLELATVVDSSEMLPDIVTMNSTFNLFDLDRNESETFTLVYPEEANIAEGKLSILAPIGTAILGYRVGDIVRWKVPTGTSRWRIEELVFQPERDCVAS